MAEALVSLVLTKIAAAVAGQALNVISTGLVQEASVLMEVKNNMKQIGDEFAVMQAFMSQVGIHDSHNRTLVAWSEQVREVAFEVEDIIDEYTYLVGQEDVGGFRNFLKKTFRHSKNIIAWHNVATQLKQVETRLKNLTSMKDRYGITVNETGGSSVSDFALRRRQELNFSYLDDEDDIVGNEEETKKLIEWLTKGKDARTIISIWGMGGLGKTTLARSIYKNPLVKNYFSQSIWITISQSYQVDDLARKILTQIVGKDKAILNGIDTMGRIELAEKVQSYLREKRYLIVLDDVWSRDAWSSLDRAFVRNNLGSRVIITTRTKDVALLADENHNLRLTALQKEEAWDLFCKKAFSKVEGKCYPQHLEHWAEKIVDKCRGLPLAIVAIGSLLSYREQQEQEWKSFYDQLNWQLTNNPELNWVVSVLNLSFNDLPSYLKNCFLYCGLFPEDYLIARKRLIRLWVAEGFVEERGPETTMEEVADSYIKELVHRSMLQVVERNDFGIAKMLQIHDLVREITLTMLRKEKFGIVCNSPGITDISAEQARRVFIHKGDSTLQPNVDLRQVRSFVLFAYYRLPSSSIENVLSNFKLLRVLSLRYANKIERIPDAVFDLFNLHYLDLLETGVKNIPKSLGKLQNLQLLDLSNTNVEKLLHEIAMLRKLRHLFLTSYSNGVALPHDICRLKCLQSLVNIEADKFLIQNIRSLTLLRKLFIRKVQGTYCTELWASLKMMPGLTTLGIFASNKDEVLRLDSIEPLPSLQKLHLKGRLDEEAVPSIFANFGMLRELRLWSSGLQKDPLSSFSHMSNLVELDFSRAYEGQRLSFRAGWFPKLKRLFLDDLEQVSAIDIEDGAMNSLCELRLHFLPNLMVPPEGIVYLRSLQEMSLWGVPRVLVERLEGNNRSKVWGASRSINIVSNPPTVQDPRLGLERLRLKTDLIRFNI